MFLVIFTNNGVRQTGLSPTIDIYDLANNSKVINAASMTEVGAGFYKYDFLGQDSDKDYVAIVDGTASISNDAERYIPLASGIGEAEAVTVTPAPQISGAGGGGLLLDTTRFPLEFERYKKQLNKEERELLELVAMLAGSGVLD